MIIVAGRGFAAKGIVLALVAVGLVVGMCGCGQPATAPSVPRPLASNMPPPPAAPAPNLSGVKFEPADLGGAPKLHQSKWAAYSDSVDIASVEGGLKCSFVVGVKREGYAGVRFAAKPFKALRLDLKFENPSKIFSVFVDGMAGEKRVLRWQWNMGKAPFNSDQAGPYVLVPGAASGYFTPRETADTSGLDDVEVFVLAAPGARTSFTLRNAEIGL